MAYTILNNKKIYYNIQGKGDPVIFLHDGFYSSMTWDNVRKSLSHKYTFIEYDRFGYGQSENMKEQINDDIIKKGVIELDLLAKELKLTQFALCGHCLGGAIALEYTVKYPNKINKLVLESTGFYSDDVMLLKSDWTFRPFEDIDKELQKNLIKMNGPSYAKIFWNIIKNHDRSYIMNKKYNKLKLLKKVKCPLLLIYGDRDFYFDVHHGTEGFKMNKNSNLWIVPFTGHTPHMEKPDDFVKNISSFL